MSAPAPEKPVNRGREHQGLSGREADLLRDLAETINASPDIEGVLQRVAEAARELCRSDVAGIALREPGSDSFAFRSWVSARAQASADLRLTVGRGLGPGGRVRQPSGQAGRP